MSSAVSRMRRSEAITRPYGSGVTSATSQSSAIRAGADALPGRRRQEEPSGRHAVRAQASPAARMAGNSSCQPRDLPNASISSADDSSSPSWSACPLPMPCSSASAPGRDLPTLVDRTEPIPVGHSRFIEVDEVGAFASERCDALNLDARVLERHEEHRDALMLLRVEVRRAASMTYWQRCAPGGEHFWPVITHSSPSRIARVRIARGVGSAIRFGIAEAAMDLSTPGNRYRRSARARDFRTAR